MCEQEPEQEGGVLFPASAACWYQWRGPVHVWRLHLDEKQDAEVDCGVVVPGLGGPPLLKREVLRDRVAAAVFTLVGGELPPTTGLRLPADGGLTAAFHR